MRRRARGARDAAARLTPCSAAFTSSEHTRDRRSGPRESLAKARTWRAGRKVMRLALAALLVAIGDLADEVALADIDPVVPQDCVSHAGVKVDVGQLALDQVVG